MSLITRSTLHVGMAHMVPNQLSEVELLKFLGDFRWRQIGLALESPPHELVNEQGQRLYSSFINVECQFGEEGISQFTEGDEIHLGGTVQFYAKQFVEGSVVLNKGEPPSDEAIRNGSAENSTGPQQFPRIYLTNAFVARVAGNVRLKTFRPVASQQANPPETEERPRGLAEQELALKSGILQVGEHVEHTRPVERVDQSPIAYKIVPESDLNGAGLLYFARYIAMMNYAERESLLRQLPMPFSTVLGQYLTTEYRRTYYFGNAPASDTIEVYCEPAVVLRDEPMRVIANGTKTNAGSLVFRHRLVRRSDGVLLSDSIVKKNVVVPNNIKSLLAEARRFFGSYYQF